MTTPLDICIVTGDIVGPIRNGGIGTAYYSLALTLARAGHRVTVLYTHGRHCEEMTIGHWMRWYARRGITFVPLPQQNVAGHPAIKASYSVYRWLADKHFDVVHYHEWRGIGFYAAQAKRQGLCLQDTVLCVGTHSPSLWHLEGMHALADADMLEVDFMERQSTALADVLWSPSRHMLQWMRREGWQLPREIFKQPYLVLDMDPAQGHAAPPDPELVFFGRLETRKGLDIFCDALDRLAARGITPRQVSFLGKIASVDGEASDDYVRRRSARWSCPWQIREDMDRDQAMAYLRAPGRVAVMPSRIDNLPYTVLECLGSGIPFLAADTGGIPEMVRPRDQKRVLFALSGAALAERLVEVHARGLRPASLRVPPERNERAWLDWHQDLARRKPGCQTAKPRRTRQPLVTVCVTHRNRPALLREALRSIRRQTYENFEVILVDDGSDAPEAVSYLNRLESSFRRRNWRILREANRYPGAARNRALESARGEYVLFMDDDNLAERREIEVLVGAAERTGADILTCFLNVFESREPGRPDTPLVVWPFLGGAAGPGVLRNVFGDVNALFRRDVFARIGGFTEDFGVGNEDWELLARAVLRGLRVDVVPEPLVWYRRSPRGVNSSTSRHANRMRALRPYLRLLPPHLRPIVHMARQERAPEGGPGAHRLDHVKRAVVFGTGSAGQLAIDLASRCGWTVPWLVDNNPSMWHGTAHGLTVRKPDALTRGGYDVVIVASLAGKSAIASQLQKMGLEPGTGFVHFLDPVRVGATTLQMHTP